MVETRNAVDTVSEYDKFNKREGIVMDKNKQIAQEVLENVGGKDNITKCFHCITRLRLELKDQSLVDKDKIEAINGVLALKIQGEQYQVVIGQNVSAVYTEFCKLADIEAAPAVEELVEEKKKITPKSIGNSIIQAVVNSVIPALPILIAAGMFKVIALLLLQFGVVDAANSTYLVLYNVGECGFHFLPIYVSINAAKHFKTNVPISVMAVSFLVLPAFMNGLADGSINNVLGIPITSTTYTSTVLPAILTVWILAYVYKFFSKVIPNMLKTVLVPSLTLFVMIPVSICVLAPLGSILGTYMAQILMWLYNTFGFIGMAIMGALRPLLIFTGMHTALIPFALQTRAELGYEVFVGATSMGYVFATAASCLAVGLKSKNTDTKASAMTCAATAFIGGVTEPALYGFQMKLKKPLIAVMIGTAVTSGYFGLTHTYFYQIVGSTSVFGIPGLVGPTGANLINGIIGLAIGMVVSFVLTWVLGFDEKNG